MGQATRYVTVSVVAGILFGAMDAIINANSYAQTLMQVYRPIARPAANVTAGVAIDLVYGFVLAGLFMLLYRSLPGQTGLAKGASFGVIVWFLRVLMSAASSWMMFQIPGVTVTYSLISGLAEILVLGVLFGLTLRPQLRDRRYYVRP